MARIARSEVFDPDEVAILHVINRCCRRCFLMGDDPVSGKNYDHRKQWLEARLEHLAGCFGIDLLCYAILSNHFHLILRSRPDVVAGWDDTEVARRWLRLCPVRKAADGQPAEPTEGDLNTIRNNSSRLATIRRRLSDISWWMRLLSQPLAARANREENQTGRFWQGRFRAVKLCDESALLACAAYVDLNPIRAAMAETLEQSDFTSVKRRLESLPGRRSDRASGDPLDQSPAGAAIQNSGQAGGRGAASGIACSPDRFLAPLAIDELRDASGAVPSTTPYRASDKGFLPLSCLEYVTLLDWTARQVVRGKGGFTPADAPPVLARLGIEPKHWSALVRQFGRLFSLVAGKPATLLAQRSRVSHRPFHIPQAARELYASSA